MKNNYHDDAYCIKKCKTDIVFKYFGNTNSQFKYSDFLRLSDEIYEASNIKLGLSTLRRFFNENYSKIPHLTTLDAFANYLGYKNWKAYKIDLQENNRITSSSVLKKPTRKLAILILSAIIILFSILLVPKFFKKDITNPDKYKDVEFFCLQKDTNVVPQTVTFHYNIKNIEFKKAQLWPLGFAEDIRDLNKEDSVIVYPYGWYNTFRPKLVIDDSIVKILEVDIQSDIWKTAVANLVPKVEFFEEYLNDTEIFTQGTLGITDEVLKKHHFTYDDIDRVYYVKATDFTNIHQDTLHFETRFKSKSIHKNTQAGIHVVRLAFEKSLCQIPVNEDNYDITQWAMLFNHFLDPQKNDLSIFKIKPNEWNTLSYRTSNKHLQIFINDNLLFERDYDIEPGHLKHVAFEFMGLGEVDYVRFYNQKGELIYNDEFD